MAFDFSSYYGSPQFSDLELVLHEETEAPASAGSKRKAAPRETLPGHAMLVCSLSPYFRAKLENWSDQDAPSSSTAGSGSSAHKPDQRSKQTVELPVPPGQLSVGQLLVKSMYHAHLDLASVPQAQLIQLLLLADRYEVAKSLAAAAAALKAIPNDAIEWETAVAVHALPAGCADNPACQPLLAAAAAKVCQELGDLEAVWVQGSDEQLVRLLSLPCAALLRLLESPDTKVASENTVANTVARWYEWQQAHAPAAEQQPTREQLRQLVGLIRMRHCSRLYVSTLFAGASKGVAAAALKPRELVEASGMAGIASLAAASPLAGCQWPVLATFPAWGGAKRPASTVGSVALDWSVSRQQLEQLVQKALDSDDIRAVLQSSTRVFMGYPLYLQVEVSSDDSSSTAGPPGSKRLELGVFVYVAGSAAGALCAMTYAIRAKQPTFPAHRMPPSRLLGADGYAAVWSGTKSFEADEGWGPVFALGAVTQPSDALQALQTPQIQPLTDDGMFLRVEVSAMY